MPIPPRTRWQAVGATLRLTSATALAIDAYTHADLATRYAANKSPGTLSQGDLFHIESGLASLAALLVILGSRREIWAFATLVAGSALAAITISANYDIGSIGPIPDMYEPLWYPEKTLTAGAEAIATGLALIGFVLAPKIAHRPTAHSKRHQRQVDQIPAGVSESLRKRRGPTRS